MSFPIPSFFKIRCGIIIIAFLLFFMFVGMLKQAFASCPSMTEPDPTYTLLSASCYPSEDATRAACAANQMTLACDCRTFINTTFNSQGMPDGTYACQTYGPVATPRTYKLFIFSSASSCPDSNNNGTPDACETCPKQQGYKTNLLIASYCGNTITQCDGSSHTSYEWGFGPDSCTPVADQPCHVTADCKKDLNQDGIADGFESGVAGGVYDSQHPTADLNGNGIPDMKDCDYDYDHDGSPNCNDPCPNNAAASCTDPCAGITDGTCKDSDGDGIADSQDSCPQNPDTSCDDPDQADSDGDGKLDRDDPCPHNADTACSDPCAGSSDTSCKDSDGDGIADSDDKCPDNPDTSCTGSGGDTTTKPYVPSVAPYTRESDIGPRFGERFRKFIIDMRSTSIFSISGQIFGDIPTGGSPSFTFNGGETFGTHELSMESWVPGLAALRAILYILAGWGAVKIALLGK